MRHVCADLDCVLLGAACSSTSQPSRRSSGPLGRRRHGRLDVDHARPRSTRRRCSSRPTNFGSMKLVQALYEARRAALDEIVGNKLLDQEAKARGIDDAALIEQEIATKVATVDRADVVAWYQANPARVQGATLDQVRAPIRSLLIAGAHRRRRVSAYVDTLKAKTPVRDHARAAAPEGRRRPTARRRARRRADRADRVLGLPVPVLPRARTRPSIRC